MKSCNKIRSTKESIHICLLLSQLLLLPSSQLRGDFAQQVACGPGPGMGQRTGIMRWCWRSWGSDRGRSAVPNLSTMESASHCGAPRKTGGGCGGRRRHPRGSGNAVAGG